MSMKQTLQRLDQTLGVVFQKDQYLSSELTEQQVGGLTKQQVEDIRNLMKKYETQLKLIQDEMEKFLKEFNLYSENVESKDEKTKILVQKGDVQNMRQCVAILYHNFKTVIKPLMEVRNVRVAGSPLTTIQIYRVEQAYGYNIEWQFDILQKQTKSLKSYVTPGNRAEDLPLGDTSSFAGMLTVLNKIMRSLKEKLLEVCAENSDLPDFSD